MEQLEYVNEHDEVIGVTSFQECFENQLTARAARVFLFDDTGKLYIQRRALSMTSAPGLWDQSAAGHLNVGESYEHAAARETEEELGIKGLTLHEIAYYYHEEPHPKHTVVKRFNKLFVAQYDGQPITFDPREVIDGRWVSIDQLEEWMQKEPQDFADGFLYVYQKYKEAK